MLQSKKNTWFIAKARNDIEEIETTTNGVF